MLQIKTILAPIDFSERSLAAAEHAAVMSDRFDAGLILAHVIQPLPFSAVGFGAGHVAGTEMYPQEQTRQAVRERLDALATKVKSGHTAQALVVQGDPAEKIEEIVQEREIGLLMMPTHGYGPFRRFLLGSVTAKVLHDVSCPVFTGAHVPEIPTTKKDPYRHVACAVDLEEHSETVLRWAHQFAQAWGARLTVVHAASAHYEQRRTESILRSAREKVDALTNKVGCSAEVEIDSQEVVPYVTETVTRAGADVLIIGRAPAGESSGRARTYAYALVRDSPCPVISV